MANSNRVAESMACLIGKEKHRIIIVLFHSNPPPFNIPRWPGREPVNVDFVASSRVSLIDWDLFQIIDTWHNLFSLEVSPHIREQAIKSIINKVLNEPAKTLGNHVKRKARKRVAEKDKMNEWMMANAFLCFQPVPCFS